MEGTAPRLRPRSVTEIVDGMFSLYRRHFLLLSGVCAITALPQAIIAIALAQSVHVRALPNETYVQADTQELIDNLTAWYAAGGLTTLSYVLFAVLTLGALSRAVSACYLGERISIVEAYTSVGIAPYLRLLGAFLLALVGVCVALVALVVGAVLLVGLVGTFSTVAAVIVGIVAFLAIAGLSIYVALHWIFVTQAVILERAGVFRSFARSWRLAHGSTLRIFVFVALLVLIVSVVFWIVTAVSVGLSLGNVTVAAGISSILGILSQPIQLGGVTLLYYDQRIRKEGFDLEYGARWASTYAR